MSSDEDESRSERLRRRRSQRQQPDETDETEEASETAESSEPSETSKPSESVKDEQVGTYMYIPESQKKEIERLYNVLKAEYEYEYDEEFEKNRSFYPLLVQHGLESLEGLDAEELRSRLQEI